MNNGFDRVEKAFVSLSGATQAAVMSMTKLGDPMFNLAVCTFRMSLFVERMNGETPHAWFFLEEVSD